MAIAFRGRVLLTACFSALWLLSDDALAGMPAAGRASPAPTTSSFPGELPSRSTSAFVVRSSAGMRVEVRARDANDVVGERANGVVTFRGGLRIGAASYDRVLATIDGGIEDFVRLPSRPSVEHVSFDVDVSSVSGLRLVENVLEFLDGQGTPRLRVRAPYIVDGTGTERSARLEVRGCAYDTSALPPWDRAVVAPGAQRCELAVRWGGEVGQPIAYPALLDPGWVDTATMVKPRNSHAAVRMSDGRVLVAGGFTAIMSSTYVPNAEIYDPTTKTWAVTASMKRGRAHFGGVLLTTGGKANQVLFAAGDDGLLATAERFDPSTATWTLTGAMTVGRDVPRVTGLADGKVLVAGGCTAYSSTCTAVSSNGEVYDPATDSWTATLNAMAEGRVVFTMNATPDGKVLAAGGCTAYGAMFECVATTGSASIFNPATNTWSAAAAMPNKMQNHLGITLPSGKVLVGGGMLLGAPTHASQIFDPTAGTWTTTANLVADHDQAGVSLLKDGTVLISGSWGTAAGPSVITAVTEIFDPMTSTWSTTTPLGAPHGDHTSTTLTDGRVLVAGGITGPSLAESGRSEVFDPAAAACSVSAPLPSGCSDCVETQCCAQLQKCDGNPYCKPLFGCFERCGAAKAAYSSCLLPCAAAAGSTGDGYDIFKALAFCVTQEKCTDACMSVGPGDAGIPEVGSPDTGAVDAGSFTDSTFTLPPPDTAISAEDTSVEDTGVEDSAAPDSTMDAASDQRSADENCSCTMPGQRRVAGGFAMSIVVAAVAMRRRRR